MQKNKIFKRITASALLCGAAAMTSAQELPIIGGLLSGGMSSGSIPLIGDLPVLGTFLPFALGELPASLAEIDLPTDQTLGGLTQIAGLAGPISGNPESLIRPIQKLALPVFFDVVPAADVLLSNPAGLMDFFTNGGTLLMPDIALIPRIPLVNQPL